jgi:hypothetical protein
MNIRISMSGERGQVSDLPPLAFSEKTGKDSFHAPLGFSRGQAQTE